MKHDPLARPTVDLRDQFARAVGRPSTGKWVKRYRELGVEGLLYRTSPPHRLAHQSSMELIQRV